MRDTARTAGSVPRFLQRWRVPFCTTVSWAEHLLHPIVQLEDHLTA